MKTKNIHTLKIPFQIPLNEGKKIDRFVNLFIIEGKYLHLIDTGVKDAESIIWQYIKSIGRSINEVKNIFLTHAHPDHIGAVKPIKENTGCKVYIHEQEKSWLEDIDIQFNERPIPGFYQLISGSAKVDEVIRDESDYKLEESITFHTIYTPGHSTGSVSFLYKEMNALFSGDAVIINNELPVYDDAEQCIHSMNKLKEIESLEFLFSSWDDIKKKREIDAVIVNGIEYLNKIDKIVKALYSKNDEPLLFCKKVLNNLDLPEFLANPLIVKSFYSHLK